MYVDFREKWFKIYARIICVRGLKKFKVCSLYKTGLQQRVDFLWSHYGTGCQKRSSNPCLQDSCCKKVLLTPFNLKFESFLYLSFLLWLKWYRCHSDLLGESVQPLFIQSHLDSGTKAFLKHSMEKSGWLFTQLYHSLVSTVLGPLVSRTSINGWVVHTHICHCFICSVSSLKLSLSQVSGSGFYVCVLSGAVRAAAPHQPRVEGWETPGPGSWGWRRHWGHGHPFQRGLCNWGLITYEMASSKEELQVSCK